MADEVKSASSFVTVIHFIEEVTMPSQCVITATGNSVNRAVKPHFLRPTLSMIHTTLDVCGSFNIIYLVLFLHNLHIFLLRHTLPKVS